MNLDGPFGVWHRSRGSEVNLKFNHSKYSTLDGLKNLLIEHGNDKEITAILDGWTVDPRTVCADGFALLTEGKRNRYSFLGDDDEITDSIKYILETGRKWIVGGAHTHPGLGCFLSKDDREGITATIDHAEKNPKIYAASGGNLEVVYDPHSNELACFKLMPDGKYERIKVSY